MNDILAYPMDFAPIPLFYRQSIQYGKILVVSVAKANCIRFLCNHIKYFLFPLIVQKNKPEIAAYNQNIIGS